MLILLIQVHTSRSDCCSREAKRKSQGFASEAEGGSGKIRTNMREMQQNFGERQFIGSTQTTTLWSETIQM